MGVKVKDVPTTAEGVGVPTGSSLAPAYRFSLTFHSLFPANLPYLFSSAHDIE